ncbi:hypothetical protein [Labilibacter marinus]|uniref:hypothetical protein n=1 Tax=Labilibacter marinus TaxID=1477105 RepID=UPI0008312987|nr:hypothetical protein [Labilibacter marinus]
MRFLFVTLTLLSFSSIKAQVQPKLFNQELSTFLLEHPAEKIYLQSDRDVYVTNDTLWFKISLTDAHSNIFTEGYRNIYIELVNDSNRCVVRNLLAAHNGITYSDFTLDNYSLTAGKYKLRTYTQYQQNYGSEFYYEKNILIKELHNTQLKYEQIEDSINSVTPNNISREIDFQILPEGGYLSYGSKCTLAFKALSANGQSVEVSGWLKDGSGNLISEIASTHAGMGKVRFIPKSGRHYNITLKKYPNQIFKVPEPENKIKMSLTALNDSIYNIKLRDNTATNQEKTYYLVSNAYGINSFFFPIKMKGVIKMVNLRKSIFKMGINRVILADDQMNPITERLIFVDKEECLNIELSANDSIFITREKVDIKLKDSRYARSNTASISACALSVNQNIQLEDYPQNIKSYLLLDSELKGHIENPSFYFKDDSASTREKLDLLLLTQGWSNYVWSKYDSITPDTLYQKEVGLEISGRIKRLFSKKGVKEGTVSVIMSNQAGFNRFSQSPTEENGTFKFAPLFFPDTISTFFQGVNKHEWKNTEIVDVKTFLNTPDDVRTFQDFITPDEKLQQEFNKKAYQRLMEDKAYNPLKYEHLLDEVTIVKNKKDIINQNDGHQRMYSFADAVISVNDDTPNFSTIWDLLAGSAAGVLVTGDNVSIRGGGEPLFLIDGIEVDKEVFGVTSVYEIDKVEILKNASNLAVFGLKGGNGAIAVYTKRGEISNKQIHVNGIKVENLRGYSLSRAFYSPNYEVNQTKQKDLRATLYWNPSVNIDSTGVGNFSFYTSDDESPILIKVEGIDSNGHIGTCYKIVNVVNHDMSMTKE